MLCHAGPPPALDLLLERDHAHPACSLAPQPLPPPAPAAARGGAASLTSPPVAPPRPSDALNTFLTNPGPLEPLPWKPELGSESLGGRYWNHEDEQVGL